MNPARPAQLLAVLFILSFSYCPSTFSHAATPPSSLKSVSITDQAKTNQPPAAAINFTKVGDIFTFDASQSIDPDGSIIEYKWDFGDGTSGVGMNTTHQFSTGSWVVTLTATDNQGGVGLVQQSVTIVEPFSLAINFQPKAANIPAEYLADSGLPFDVARGYGWTMASYKDFLDRNNPKSLDQSYDTLVNVYPDGVWEAAVANGAYSVKILVGDATSPWGTQNVQVEGTLAITSEILSSSIPWIERESVVNVIDGRLTVTFTGSSPMAKLCRILIKSATTP